MNADKQIRWGLKYIRRVYRRAAEKPGWYDRGGVLPKGMVRVVNETGMPEPVKSPGDGSGTP